MRRSPALTGRARLCGGIAIAIAAGCSHARSPAPASPPHVMHHVAPSPRPVANAAPHSSEARKPGQVVYSGSCRTDDDCSAHRRCLLLQSTDPDGTAEAYGSCVPRDQSAYPAGYPPGTIPP